MFRALHIAFSLLGLTALLFLAGPCYVNAQNTWSSPYLNSTHLYRVPMGNTGNTVVWELYDNLAEDKEYTLDGSHTWATPAVVGANAEIAIKWISATFTNGSTWYLVYNEYNSDNCVARRSITITPVDNSFYLTLGADEENCHPLDHTVLNWNNINATRIEVVLEFTVYLHKANNFAPSWSFTATPTFGPYDGNTHVYQYPGSGNTTIGASTTGTTDDGHSFTATYNAGNITVTVNGSTATEEEDFLTLQVPVSGYVYEGQVVTLTLSNGLARSGTSYTVVTDDNTDEPDPPPISTPRQQALTVWPLPATLNIAMTD